MLWTLQIARGKWFHAYYNHYIIRHSTNQLDPSTARWGLVPDTHPWWSSVEEAAAAAGADLLDSYGKGINKWPAQDNKNMSLAVNPDLAIPWENWAGWRTHYMA